MPTGPVRKTLIIWLENGSWVSINLSSGFCKRDVAPVWGSHCEILGRFPLNQISGNFGLKLNGTVRSNRKSFEKIGPPLEVDHFFGLDRSDRNGPFHLTIPTHSKSQYLAVRYFYVQHELTWRKTLSMPLLWIVNSGSIGDTYTPTCS